ncbi:AI-2E family transporter [Desulforhopalus sp. 52FAK]
MMDTKVPMSNSAIVKVAAFIIIIAGIKAASSLIVPFILAIFLSIICAPLFFFLKNKGVPEMLGLLLILVFVVGVWTGVVILVGTSLSDFSTNVPVYQERLTGITRELWGWFATHGVTIDTSSLEELFNPGKLMMLVAGTLNGLGGILTNAFLILLTFVFLLLEATGISDKIKAIHWGSKSPGVDYAAIGEGVNRYLGIKTLTSFFTAVIVYVLVRSLGIDFPILWALLAFLLNFIPNIGSIIAAIPPILLALIQFGFGQALLTALGFLVINIGIGSILEPKVMGRGVGLSVLVVFLSLSFWGWVLGPVGMLLSVPLTMAVKIGLANSESNRWIALLLASNREVALYIKRKSEAGVDKS